MVDHSTENRRTRVRFPPPTNKYELIDIEDRGNIIYYLHVKRESNPGSVGRLGRLFNTCKLDQILF
jgi:hypothetical protein